MLGDAGQSVRGDWYYHASMPCYGLENCSDMEWEGAAVRWAGSEGLTLALSLPGVPLEMAISGVRFSEGRPVQQMTLLLQDLKLAAATDGTGVYRWPLPYPLTAQWLKFTIRAEGIAPDAGIARLFCFSDISVRRRRG